MATKTIMLELDAYEQLKRAKRSPRESFSSVVRRARFDEAPPTVTNLLTYMDTASQNADELVSDTALDALEAAQLPWNTTTRYLPEIRTISIGFRD
ncbi:MAG: antitoxin VapB family protein [Spirochaeta sp.]|jgi:hypothetical protein|nr:antitoxin VapB family protein [Spirochaeta sp.]